VSICVGVSLRFRMGGTAQVEEGSVLRDQIHDQSDSLSLVRPFRPLRRSQHQGCPRGISNLYAVVSTLAREKLESLTLLKLERVVHYFANSTTTR
jgi:hypothetical protein